MTGNETRLPEARRARRQVAVFVVLVLAILTVCWTVVGMIAAPALPGGGWTAASLWVLFTLVPLGVFLVTRARGIRASFPDLHAAEIPKAAPVGAEPARRPRDSTP